MSDAATAASAPETPADNIAKSADAISGVAEALKGLGEKRGQTPGFAAPRKSDLGDRPYSFLRLIKALTTGKTEGAKYEAHVHETLLKNYTAGGYRQQVPGSVLVPMGTGYLPDDSDDQHRFNTELAQKFDHDARTTIDGDEVGYVRKALGTTPDTAGGYVQGFPEMRELIDMMRNREVFSVAGASQVPLGANGQAMWPKLISGATAYFIGENPSSGINESQQTFGALNLQAKTLAVLVPTSNQILQFSLPSAEAIIRSDIARVAALKLDSVCFNGVGGNEIKGLLTYPTQSTWASGTDKLISVTATTTGGNGDTLNSIDLYRLMGALPDTISDSLTWVFKKSYFYTRIATARSAGSAAGDGLYLFSPMRTIDGGVPSQQLLGNRLVLSSQVPDRTKGSGTTLTCAILGHFPDWMIARSGVAEIAVNQWAGTQFAANQSLIRLITYVDAGPRHAASFGVVDSLLTSAFTA
jgi:HK97 family phage major capsid protein